MNTKTKKTIAKEIIYFFSAITLLLVFWVGIEIRNFYLRNKIKNFSNEISDLKVQIDSVEKTYTKEIKDFYDLIPLDYDKLPDIDELNHNIKKPKFDPLQLFTVPNSDLPNIIELYSYLKENEFDFSLPHDYKSPGVSKEDLSGAIPLDADCFEVFIKNEFIQEKQPYIEKIYMFIKSKNKKFNCKIASFIRCLEGLPELPPNKVLEQVEQLKKTKTETNQKLQETENKLMIRDETKNMLALGSALLLGLLYPFRFIFFLLLWAFKTVKQKEQ